MVLDRFGEDEHIKIQNLALETEARSPELNFNVADYFDETDLAHLREDLDEAGAANNWDGYSKYSAQLKLLLPQNESPFKFDSRQRRAITARISDRARNHDWNLVTARFAELRILFPEHADDIKPLRDSWREMLRALEVIREKDLEAYYDLVLALKIIDSTSLDAKYLDDNIWEGLKNTYDDSLVSIDNFTVRYLFLAKALFPEKSDELKFNPSIWESMKSSLRAWKNLTNSHRPGQDKLFSWYPALSMAGQMRLIAAGDIRVTDRGFESVPQLKRKSLTPAHDLPVSRNF